MSIFKEFTKGFWKENPVLVLVLGMCPTLATSSDAVKGLAMGLATTFVLMGSNLVISVIRKLVPGKIRIPCYIVVIATFVTVVKLLMQAYAPEAYQTLGIFLPLIVVNCIVLGRAEAFASKNGLLASAADGLGMGLGFTFVLVCLGCIREFLAAGTLRLQGSLHCSFVSRICIRFSLLKDSLGLGFLEICCLLGKIRPSDLADTRKNARFYTDTAAAMLFVHICH